MGLFAWLTGVTTLNTEPRWMPQLHPCTSPPIFFLLLLIQVMVVARYTKQPSHPPALPEGPQEQVKYIIPSACSVCTGVSSQLDMPGIPPQGRILIIRCPNHINRLLFTSRKFYSFQMPELLTLSQKVSPDTIWREVLPAVCICVWFFCSLPRGHDCRARVGMYIY